MKQIATKDAVGNVLCHDITQIVPGQFKGARFTKGHVVTEEDIPVLLSLGKEHLYVWEKDDRMYHENEAAGILYRICVGEDGGGCFAAGEPSEGKINITAAMDGLLKADAPLQDALNGMGELVIASRHGNTTVKKGDLICGTRVVPLVIEKAKMERAVAAAAGRPIFRLLPFKKKRVGLVTTGTEVFLGRIEDKFGPVLRAKVEEFGSEIMGQTITDDDPAHIEEAIRSFLEKGADMVLCSGGMSVDPDDRTPLAVRNSVSRVVSYGAPVLPGSMLMLGYVDPEGASQPTSAAEPFAASQDALGNDSQPTSAVGSVASGAMEFGLGVTNAAVSAAPRPPIPVVGLPGCVMYSGRTIFDLVLPRLLADDPVTHEDMARMGRGGLCLKCPTCTFPNCGFGKGA
ncbi:MAG: molybdopterin-binding protein [Lachnospiraceae bacterium]|jgi:molybdenum cofactor synthesis domain-containing protein|nr:molybdopterin-binding protein [Lachnospiraceae bacterium]